MWYFSSVLFSVGILTCQSFRNCLKPFHNCFRLKLTDTGNLNSEAVIKPRFSDFREIPQWLLDNCQKLGYEMPTTVQEKSLNKIFEGKDVIIQAQTGSGKTLCFVLPILAKVDPDRAAIQAVIVVPTRELGLQVSAVLKQLGANSPSKIMVMSLVEGSKNRRQMLWATAEPPHIIVGNPKSLQKLVDAGRLRLNAVSYVVLDEVDACLIKSDTRQELHRLLSRHLSTSYQSIEEIEQMQQSQLLDKSGAGKALKQNRVFKDLAVRRAPRGVESLEDQLMSVQQERQTIMCSATIPQRQHFAVSCYKNGWTSTLPEVINVSQQELVPLQVRHEHIPCEPDLLLPCLKYLLRAEAKQVAAGEKKKVQVIVFATVEGGVAGPEACAAAAAGALGREGKEGEVRLLVDSMGINNRATSVKAFLAGECEVLICSDLAARGLDLPSTTLVIQMYLPNTVEQYLHRSGRTGRMGREGKVITLTRSEEEFVVTRYANQLGVPIHKRQLKPKT